MAEDQTTSATSKETANALVALLTFAPCGGDHPTKTASIGTSTSADIQATASTDAPTSIETAESGGLDPTAFFDAALLGRVTTTDCTLASVVTASCCANRRSSASPPNRDSIGLWYPSTTSDTAGDAVYDLDGQFILDLAETYGDPNRLLWVSPSTASASRTARISV